MQCKGLLLFIFIFIHHKHGRQCNAINTDSQQTHKQTIHKTYLEAIVFRSLHVLQSLIVCTSYRISIFIVIHYVIESVSFAINLSNILAINTIGNSKLKKRSDIHLQYLYPMFGTVYFNVTHFFQEKHHAVLATSTTCCVLYSAGLQIRIWQTRSGCWQACQSKIVVWGETCCLICTSCLFGVCCKHLNSAFSTLFWFNRPMPTRRTHSWTHS